MIRRLFSTLIVIGVLCSLIFVVTAQDGTTESTTLEEITSNSPDFYGQTVTLEGTVVDFLNTATFVLGEDAVLDSDSVLVINNSGRSLPLAVAPNAYISVTGIVHGSIEAHEDGTAVMDEDPMAEPTTEDMAEEPMEPITGTMEDDMTETDDMDMMYTTEDAINFYLSGQLPDDYNNYTVIEITDINSITFHEPAQG